MLACLENTIDAADGTDDLPGNMRTMICSGEHPRRVEIAAPIKTHGCHSHSRGQMERTRVVGDHHAATTQEARQSAKRDTVADILRLRFHRAHDLLYECLFFSRSCHYHMSVGPGKSIAYSRKLLRWPATLGITGTRMQGHQRFLPFRHDLPGFVHIRRGSSVLGGAPTRETTSR